MGRRGCWLPLRTLSHCRRSRTWSWSLPARERSGARCATWASSICPPDYNEYSVYVAGELILTNLGFAFGNPGMAEKSLLTMLRRDVAAIAVKTVY